MKEAPVSFLTQQVPAPVLGAGGEEGRSSSFSPALPLPSGPGPTVVWGTDLHGSCSGSNSTVGVVRTYVCIHAYVCTYLCTHAIHLLFLEEA